MLNEKAANRAITGDESNITYHLTVFSGDVLTFNVDNTCERHSLRNYCTEVNTEVKPDGIKYAHFAIDVADSNLCSISIMHLIEVNYSPVEKHSLLHDDTNSILATRLSIQVKSMKYNSAIESNKNNMNHVFTAYLSGIFIL